MKFLSITLLFATAGLGFCADAILTDDVSLADKGQTVADRVKYAPDAPRLRISNKDITYLKFDIERVLPSGIVAADIDKAILKVWVPRTKDFSEGYCAVRKVTGLWHEHGPLRPGLAPRATENVDLVRVSRTNQFVTFDVTSAVKDWLNGDINLGLALEGKATPPTVIIIVDPENVQQGPSVKMSIDSKENAVTSHAPMLQIITKIIRPAP